VLNAVNGALARAIDGAVGAAVILMTKALARELSRWSIRVNSVAMTITSGTPSWDTIFATESFQSKLFTKAVGRFPLGRPPSAGEVADVAVFLAADAAQVAGQTVSVNGGLPSAAGNRGRSSITNPRSATAVTVITKETTATKTKDLTPVIVVDPGSPVDLVHPRAMCQIRTAAGAAAHDRGVRL
jgi:hypothetical protein